LTLARGLFLIALDPRGGEAVITTELKRKLSAIPSVDVKGYSLLMGEDEAWTIRTLKSCKALISEGVRQHHGRVADPPGDNVQAEFGSVVDAVQCAVEIQPSLPRKNGESPEAQRMEFRIDVNLGDVVEDEEKFFGDGVNIATRLN
jgi:adenylate cyclase